MSCFIVPLTQAVVTTVVRKRNEKLGRYPSNAWMQNLPKLELMLWGGSLMLIVDHIINGELTYYFPFFTALEKEGGAYTMLREVCTTGLCMSIIITFVYTIMVALRLQTEKE